MVIRKYYYTQLSHKERKIYEDLYAGLLAYEEDITTIAVSNIKQVIGKIMKAVLYDHPEIFYIDTAYSYSFSQEDTKIHIHYIFSKSQIRTYNMQIMQKGKEITNWIRSRASDDPGREKLLYEYFASHYIYDHTVYPSSAVCEISHNHSILGALRKETAVCSGFAKTFKYIMDRMGMECMVVNGYSDHARAGRPGEEGRHAWNIVYLNGRCQHVDVTWAICISAPEDIRYDYLNLSDRQIRCDHKGFGGVPICR